MNNRLALQTGVDIPFVEARTVIHQPTCEEISLIGETDLQVGSRFLNFSKFTLAIEDKNVLEGKSDFDIFIAIINAKEYAKYKASALKVMSLLFPDYQIKVDKQALVLTSDHGIAYINTMNYEVFRDYIVNIFCLNGISGEDSGYNPNDGYAAKIAEKFNKRKEQLSKLKGQSAESVNIIERYISILAAGEHKDKNELKKYTMWQLLDEFERYTLKYRSDIHTQALLAGAKDDDKLEDWMKDFSIQSNN